MTADPNWYWDETIRRCVYAWRIDSTTGRVVRFHPDDHYETTRTEQEVSDVQENIELAELLASLTLEDLQDLTVANDALRDAMDARDAIKAEQTVATAALEAQLEAVNAPFKERLLAASAVFDEAKDAIIRRLAADDAEQLAAMAAKRDVPAPRALPKGLQVKRSVVLGVVDMEKLPPEFTRVVANESAILKATEAGETVPGAEVSEKISVQLRRS